MLADSYAHVMAAGEMNPRAIDETAIVSICLEQERRIRELQERVEEIQN